MHSEADLLRHFRWYSVFHLRDLESAQLDDRILDKSSHVNYCKLTSTPNHLDNIWALLFALPAVLVTKATGTRSSFPVGSQSSLKASTAWGSTFVPRPSTPSMSNSRPKLGYATVIKWKRTKAMTLVYLTMLFTDHYLYCFIIFFQ